MQKNRMILYFSKKYKSNRKIKALTKRINNLSIRKKFFIGYLLAALIPMCIITFYSYNTTKSNLIRQSYADMENSLLQTNKNIENTLETYSRTSALIYLNTTLKDYLGQNYRNSSIEDAYYYFNNYFGNILSSNTGVSLVTVYTSNETLPPDKYFIKPWNSSIRQENWYSKLTSSTGNTVYGSTFKNENNRYVFTVLRYLNSGNITYPYGILVMTIDENQLYSLIENSSAGSFSYIIDEKGSIISCKDKSMLTSNIGSLLNIGASQLSENGSQEITYNNNDMLMVYKSMGNGWKTIALVPYENIISSARKSASFVFLVFTAGILLVSILIYLLSAILTKRINNIAKQVEYIKLGNFDIQINDAGGDEIGKLSDAFNRMSKKLKFLIEEVYQKELQKKQAEMNVLQEQINPHFLYNALASISSLALRSNDKNVNEMTSLLGKFYRLSLNKGRNILSVHDEMELTRYYIKIQEIRFRNLIKVFYVLDESLMDFKVPKLILQPFIENSINHGIWDDARSLSIVIKLYKENHYLIFEVIDDGIGIDRKTYSSLLTDISREEEGFGTRNVNKRIKLYYGEDYGINIFSKPGIGTQIKITLPLQK